MKVFYNFFYFINIGCVYCSVFNSVKVSRSSFLSRRKCDGDRLIKKQKVGVIYSENDPDHLISIKSISLPVDHFDNNNEDKWLGRFVENKEFFKSNSPVYIRVGDHTELVDGYVTQGFMYELAKSTDGALFHIEHRYYGRSELEHDIKYLHTTQVIEDVKSLIERIKATKGYEHSKVILFGVEHGASLAIWTKQKYPNLVYAVVADSPLLLAKVDASEVIENTIEITPDACRAPLFVMIRFMVNCIQKGDYLSLKASAFICPAVDITKVENQQHYVFYELHRYFRYRVLGTYRNLMIYCEQYPSYHQIVHLNGTDDVALMPPPLIKRPCVISDLDLYIKYSLKRPLHTKDELFELHQSCNEFGLFPTTSSLPEPYSKLLPVSFYQKLCSGAFGDKYDEKELEKKINETNQRYGGLSPNVTKVIYVNAELDTWKTFGKPLNPDKSSLVIPLKNEQAGAFLYLYHDSDSNILIQARNVAKRKIEEWLEAK